MQSLIDHQHWLASLILEPERLAADPARAVRPVALDDVELARTRLGAYVDGYPARLREALEEAYPALRNIIGHDAFVELVDRYRTMVPAGVYSLTDVGENLPAFLATDSLAAALPFLPDLAALEWRVLRAFHSFELHRFDPNTVAGWGMDQWEIARVTFQPSVAVVRSRWPVLDLWNVRDTARKDINLVVDGRPQNVLVYRDALSVACDAVTPAKAVLLAQLLDGASLGVAAESLTESSGSWIQESIDEPLDVGAWFAHWTALGLIVDCNADTAVAPRG